MDTYTNNYIVNNHLEVLVGEHEPGVRQFSLLKPLDTDHQRGTIHA